ncbi:PPA1309 family protein [Streptoalloteichus hindustanus]|uniref:Uncharacterized protein n=1 Tax=Streptoalloteichus hindustanus TaxID=2017 RepID=A0A1M5JBY9_STRHI|nr:PPA1309 family protein [Streptoalloteichus hindustanus]SHG37760.1 hypothetical protein SAMN05444320_108207 [Streptoalloteichus hindustanus]
MASLPSPDDLSAALPSAVREVEDFVSTSGWDQAPQLFALVSTADLLARQPGLADQLDPDAPLTPIAQDPLPEGDLGESLAKIEWPDIVAGCALSQEIVVLPPEAEAEIAEADSDLGRIQQLAAEHPQRQEARLVAAVLRNGAGACVLRVRGGGDEPDQLIERPDLAPNLVSALYETLS